ncbi:MAG: tRNA (adenosine(37)-N6)-threonylcarbamoyltransferase complex dimerization subunit type 1 TsaB [Bacteroidales bacterium]|nr:tRNA (adenosine(37)-N6)-threonylcarbamoyltransferase complex dimerization subunit type 1 TsaB [Bacteroidales bacterium]
MAFILCIETSTNICSVALCNNGKVLTTLEEHQTNSHASLLTVMIQQMMTEKGITMDKLEAVAVSCGPGSYTGLRIGVSVAKGICFALQIPLIAVSSLQIVAAGVLLNTKEQFINQDTIICPMIDARRMEVYSALYNSELILKDEIKAEIIDSTSYTDQLEKHKIIFAGNGSQKCESIIRHNNALFLENIYPLAGNMASLANMAYISKKFEDVAYFEPFYLKDFIATIPKRKIF